MHLISNEYLWNAHENLWFDSLKFIHFTNEKRTVTISNWTEGNFNFQHLNINLHFFQLLYESSLFCTEQRNAVLSRSQSDDMMKNWAFYNNNYETTSLFIILPPSIINCRLQTHLVLSALSQDGFSVFLSFILFSLQQRRRFHAHDGDNKSQNECKRDERKEKWLTISAEARGTSTSIQHCI